MIEIKRNQECCGCGACAQICPRQAITMIPDEEGFAYPKVDTEQCIRCGSCQRVCPMHRSNDRTDDAAVTAFAAYAKDGVLRTQSSSGGVFSVLALWVLQQGGVVFGAAMVQDLSVGHICVESAGELYRLRGSKYVQSTTGETFRAAKAYLDAGRMVLYSGVACQIAGLKGYLQRDYETLYTLDVLCHGVPSPAVWARYVQHLQSVHGSDVCNVNFREKSTGWKQYSVETVFINGQQHVQKAEDNSFMRCFIQNICLRPSCHACRFKEFPRVSDLTLGDAWGIQKHMPDMDDDRGTSAVLIHSEKGWQLWNAVQDALQAKACQLDVLLPPGADSRRSVSPHPNRGRFMAAVGQGAPWEELQRLQKVPAWRKAASKARHWVVSLKK